MKQRYEPPEEDLDDGPFMMRSPHSAVELSAASTRALKAAEQDVNAWFHSAERKRMLQDEIDQMAGGPGRWRV